MENPYSTPQSDLALESSSDGDITKFKRFSTWGVLALSIITFGIYSIYWLHSRTKVLNDISENPISKSFTGISIAFYVANIVFSFAAGVNPELEILSQLVNLPSSILMIVWAFKMRNRLEPIMNKSLGGVMVFFFNVYYLNYKINESIDEVQGS